MQRTFVVGLIVGMGLFTALPRAQAGEGPFVGVNLGVAEPENDNYRAHVKTGASASPYAGYMLNDYLGLQGEFHFTFQEPDNDNRRSVQTNIENENQTTTLAGLTLGPRLQLPLGEIMDLYVTAQGGGYKGLGGRLNQMAPGFSVGGGLDFNLTPEFAIGLFGRWNRAYMSPHPTFLLLQEPGEQGPSDIRWVDAGVSLKYSFTKPAAPPPPPAPIAKAPPPPPPPAKRKIVLRGVNFDFDKYNIRPDAVPVLDEAVSTLKEEGSVGVVCEGHTDSKGSDAYNMKLSKRRAEAVRTYLITHGIAQSRVKAAWFGESKPVAPNDTEDGRAQNRRTELKVD